MNVDPIEGKRAPSPGHFAEHLPPLDAGTGERFGPPVFDPPPSVGEMLGVELVDFGSDECRIALAGLDSSLRARITRICLGATAQSLDDRIERFVMLRAVPRGKYQNTILEIVKGRAAMERRARKSRAFGRPLVVRLAPGSST